MRTNDLTKASNPRNSMIKTEKVRVNNQRYVYARDNGHLLFNEKAKVCDRYFRGDHWAAKTKADLEAEGRPALTINKVLPAVAAILGEQMNEVADIGFKPIRGGNMETSNALNQTFIHITNWNRLGEKEADVFEDGVITSRGYFDCRMNYEENIFGDVKITQLNPRNVVLDPDSEEYDPKSWKDVIVTKWLSIQDIEMFYGKGAADELRSMAYNENYLGYDFLDIRPDTFGGENTRFTEFGVEREVNEYRRVYRILERQYKKIAMQEHFVDLRTGEVRPISPGMPREKVQLIQQEFNVAIIKKRVEQIHWTVTCNDTLLHDSKSPYRSFTVVPFFPFFRHGQTIGLVENMIDPQNMYNKTRSQELHIVNTTANSGWQGEEGQLTNMTDEELEERGAETGLVLMRRAGSQPLEKITPNQVPTGLDRISQLLNNDLKEMSMVSDSMRGFDRADVAAKAIQAKQAQGSTNFTKVLHNLNKSRMILARNIMELMQDFMREERILQITKGVGNETEEVTINEVTPEGQIARDLSIGKYEVVVTSVPARETFEESQFQQAIQLRELGVEIPDTTIIAASHLPDKQELLEQMSNDGGPTEEEQALMDLEMQIKQLEAQKTEAETAKIRAETAISMIDAEQGPGGELEGQVMTVDDQIKMAEVKHNYEKDLATLELDKYEIDEKMRFAREELAVKRQEIRSKHVMELTKARTADKAVEQQGASDAGKQGTADRALDQKSENDAGKLKVENKKADKPTPKPAGAKPGAPKK